MKDWNWKKLFITLFRVAIGWHFLYEGFSKMLAGNWSATGYLAHSTGPFAGFDQSMAASEGIMNIIDPIIHMCPCVKQQAFPFLFLIISFQLTTDIIY